MKRLYEVEITIRAVIVAESFDDAHMVVSNCEREIVRESDSDEVFVVRELAEDKPLPHGWDAKCYPYGQRAEQTIEDIWKGI